MKTAKRLKSLLATREIKSDATSEAGGSRPAAAVPSKISLELLRPEARTVFVAGSFNGWKPETTPLHAMGNGRWKGDLALNPGRYEHLFVVDGQWLPDPNARETVDNPYGGRNSVVTVAA